MKASKIVSLIFLFTFFTTILFAQGRFFMPKYKDVLKLKDRQPIVVINPPDSKTVTKLAERGDDNAMQAYQKAIGDYNDAMKNAVTKFWTFNSQPVLFKTRDELKIMYEDKSVRDKYVLIYCWSEAKDYNDDFDWDVSSNDRKITGSVVDFTISLGWDQDPVYEAPLDVLVPSPRIMSFYVSKTNFIFNYLISQQKDCKMPDMINNNAHILSQKTLLIVDASISKQFIDSIKTYYPCNYKIVDNAVVDSAVLSGNPAYAYVMVTGISSSLVYTDWVVNCADGDLLADSDYGKPGAFKVVQYGFGKEFFQDIAKFCSGTMKK